MIICSRFEEGRTTILTLKDSNILDDKEDTLVNVNIVDDEHVEKVNCLCECSYLCCFSYIVFYIFKKKITSSSNVIVNAFILFLESQAKIEEG